jgi:hypothetical protein
MIEMPEGYRQCKGYPLYAVGPLGQVFNLKTGKHLKIGLDRDGYPRVAIYNENGSKTIRVHRLVAEAFIPNPDNKPVVNHKDGIKTNNKTYNLEWTTQKENYRHATGFLKVGMHKFTVDDILLAKLQMMINLMEELKRRDDCTRPMEEKINRTLRKLRE